MPSSRSTASPSAASGRIQRPGSSTWAGPAPTQAELAAAFARALDLAEGRRPDHAARVCYIALRLAPTAKLNRDQQSYLYYAALLHDAGASPASAELCRRENLTEEAIFGAGQEKHPQELALEIAPEAATDVVEALRSHPQWGAQVARDLGFDAPVQEAIAAHHERWDGHGYPKALRGDAIPITARIVAAADLVESLISSNENALAARRTLLAALGEHAGRVLDPQFVGKARELATQDAFWLGLYRDDLTQEIASTAPRRAGPVRRDLAHLEAFARVFGELADAKGEHTARHGARTAEIAVQFGQELGFLPAQLAMLRIAAQLHDVGLLGVPARIIAKPDILSLSEMQEMRQHPTYSQLVLEALPGLEEAALWVGAHHERPDGKGYPEMLETAMIPVEARIIALADSYVALTSTRPYRQALSHEDAQQVLLGGAGTQLDRKLAQLFCALPLAATSSRTARRSQRTR